MSPTVVRMGPIDRICAPEAGDAEGVAWTTLVWSVTARKPAVKRNLRIVLNDILNSRKLDRLATRLGADCDAKALFQEIGDPQGICHDG